jgi:hypothetical protein
LPPGVAFHDHVMRPLGRKTYVTGPPFFDDWLAGEYMLVIVHFAHSGDRFSQFRVGLHHRIFRAASHIEMNYLSKEKWAAIAAASELLRTQ